MSDIYPIFGIEAAQAYERGVLRGDPSMTAAAMENAGRAIGCALYDDYREIREWPAVPNLHVLCGKGLNTGDALIACETLHANFQDLKVSLVLTVPEKDLNPLTATVLERLQSKLGESLETLTVDAYLERGIQPVDVVLDGLYGLGFQPPLRPEVAELLRRVNRQPEVCLRASIDLPSGIGEATDPDSFVADFTYIPGVAKAPCFRKENSPLLGRIRFLEIDPFKEQPHQADAGWYVASPNCFKDLNRLRPSISDKRTYGHCLILAGSLNMPGAAIMSTLAALQSGAGLVTTLTPAPITSRIAGVVPEAMWRTLPLTPDGGLDVESVRMVAQASTKAGALLIGPGLVMDRPTVFSICRIIRETRLPLVLDASALTQETMAAILGRSLTAGPVIMTPHRGEYARILGPKDNPDDDDGLKAFSQKYRAVVILKGSSTLVSDGEKIIATPVGGPVLARGGAGDLLSGMVTALLAQNVDNPLRAALMATTWHGAAADSLAREKGSIAVRTTELLAHLSSSLRN